MTIREALEMKATAKAAENGAVAPAVEEMTIRDVYEDWARQMLSAGKMNRLSKYGFDKEFADWLLPIADRRARTITRPGLSTYVIQRMDKENLGWKDWESIRDIIYHVFDHAEKIGATDFDFYDVVIDVETEFETTRRAPKNAF